MSTRREALLTIAAVTALPAWSAQPGVRRYFSPEELKLLSTLVDVILPPTDTPGAAAAGVPLHIDGIASRTELTGEALRHGLNRLHAGGFAGATPERRVEMVAALQDSADPFFKLIKDLTIDGYYASRQGLVSELGYHGNTYLSEFPGCTHPEHQIHTDAD